MGSFRGGRIAQRGRTAWPLWRRGHWGAWRRGPPGGGCGGNGAAAAARAVRPQR